MGADYGVDLWSWGRSLARRNFEKKLFYEIDSRGFGGNFSSSRM